MQVGPAARCLVQVISGVCAVFHVLPLQLDVEAEIIIGGVVRYHRYQYRGVDGSH